MIHASLQGLTVLVLEDEYLIALDVERLCREHGASEVRIARSLEELGADPLAEHFDVVVLDVMLGGQSTTSFASRLLCRSIPFVFATGYSDDETMFEGFETVPVVAKPYSDRDLVAALVLVIERGSGA